MTQQPIRQLKLGANPCGVGMDHTAWRDPDLPSDATLRGPLGLPVPANRWSGRAPAITAE